MNTSTQCIESKLASVVLSDANTENEKLDKSVRQLAIFCKTVEIIQKVSKCRRRMKWR